MKLKDLINKIEKANKLNEELEVAEKIINNELEKVERYTYKILDTEFELVLEF